MKEYECICGHVWIDDVNYGCPMCGNRADVVWREYEIQQPKTFANRKENTAKVGD